MSTNQAAQSDDDISVTCGICLEESWRSEPQILPCQHTFCLTCLTTLAQQDNSSRQETLFDLEDLSGTPETHTCVRGGLAGRGEEGSTSLAHTLNRRPSVTDTLDPVVLNTFAMQSIRCPTCQTAAIIPEGGVSNLASSQIKTNRNLQMTLKPFEYECNAGAEGADYFKSHSHSHTGYQSSALINVLGADHDGQPSATEHDRAQDLQTKVTEGAKVAEAELERSGGDSERQRRTLSDDVIGFHCAGLGHVTVAGDESSNLATAKVQSVQEVQAMKMAALPRREGLKQQAIAIESSGIPVHSQKVFQEALLGVRSLQHFHYLPLSARSNSFSNASAGLGSSDVKDVRHYAKEAICTSDLETDPKSMQDICDSMLLRAENQGRLTPDAVTYSFQNCGLGQNWLERYSEMAGTVDNLKEICTQMKDNEVLLKAENITLRNCLKTLQQDVDVVRQLSLMSAQSLSRLEGEVSDLQGNGKIVSQSETELQTLVSNLRQELTSFKEEKGMMMMMNESLLQELSSNLYQELTSLKEENEELKKISTGLERDKNILMQEMTSLKEENLKLEQRSTDLERDKEVLWKEMTSLQEENGKLGERLTDLQRNKSQLWHKMASLKTDNAKFKQSVAGLKRGKSLILQRMSRLQSSKIRTRRNIEYVIKQNSEQSKDLMLCKSQVLVLQHDVGTIIKVHKILSSKLRNLEAQLCKTGRQVAFHAILCTELTTSCEQILVNDGVVTNVGNGYNDQTGIFEAPVPGIYLFLFTTSPLADGEHSRLDLVLDNERVGYLYATGDQTSSAHAAVKMEAGQKAWLRTYSGEESIFKNNFVTSFSGILIQSVV